MLPSDYLMFTGKSMQGETRNFTNGVLLNLLNMLTHKDADAKLVDILSGNDIYAFTTDRAVVLSFSSSRYLNRPVLTEIPLDEIKDIDFSTDVDTPVLIATPDWNNFLSQILHCVNPISVIFPASYLSLQSAEAEDAHRKVATILLPICEADIDRKMRIVRVNPIFRGRDFLLDPQLCFVLMEFKSPYLEIYEKLIAPTVTGEGLTCQKSNDIFSTTSVIEDIWEKINRAALVIAEISSTNPNVMYELGVCHTIGKAVGSCSKSVQRRASQ